MKQMNSIIAASALVIAPSLSAASLAFTDFNLIEGNDRQQGARYRFNDVTAGVDAIVTIEVVTANATINQIDDPAAGNDLDPIDQNAWRPIITGVSPDGASAAHGARFSIGFVAENSFTPVTVDGFGVSIYDTDGDGDTASEASGDLREFVRLDGSLVFAGDQLTVSERSDGRTQVIATTSETNSGVTDTPGWRSDWTYGNTESFSITLAMTGTDDTLSNDNRRLYGAYFTGDSEIASVPEPSTILILGLASIPLLFRRKR